MTGMLLLTGATGFVGRQVLRILDSTGLKVRVVVRRGSEQALEPVSCIESVVVVDDLFAQNAEWWEGVCMGVDTIIHVAWYAKTGQYLQSDINIDCLMGTLQLAKGASKVGLKHFVGIGTCFEYDLSAGMLSIDTPLRPHSPYASAKAAAYLALSQWLPSRGVKFTWCRLFYLYGEGEAQERLMPYLHSKLSAGEYAELTSGNQIRDYLEVKEAASLIVQAALGDDEGPVNICSGVPVTVRQIAEKVADQYGRRDLLKFGARPDNLVDPACVVGIRSEGLQ